MAQQECLRRRHSSAIRRARPTGCNLPPSHLQAVQNEGDPPMDEESGSSRRKELMLRLGRLKRAARELEEKLGLHVTPPLPLLPQGVGQTVMQLFAAYAVDFLSVHEANGDYVYASANCEPLFGWRPEDLIGHSAYEFFHEK